MIGTVYLFKEKESGKCYVGRTLHPSRRFKEHINASENKVFHKRIKELGVNGNVKEFLNLFDYEILYTIEYNNENKVEVSNVLDKVECEYIKQYNSVIPNGYNEQSFSHTTVKPLTDKQKEKAKRNYGKNNNITNNATTSEKHAYYYKYIETPEMKEIRINNCKAGMQRYFNTPEMLIRKEETRLKQEELKRKKQQERLEYWESEEGKKHKEEILKKSSERITAYNKSDEHRQAAINSNKNRWKDGCPKTTRNKIGESNKKAQARRKGQRWMHKDDISKMIIPSEQQKYLDDGWSYGRI